MAKYNIREYKESGASYQESINPDILDELHTKILNILLIQRKFMDKDYSAALAATEHLDILLGGLAAKHECSQEIVHLEAHIARGHIVYGLEDGKALV